MFGVTWRMTITLEGSRGMRFSAMVVAVVDRSCLCTGRGGIQGLVLGMAKQAQQGHTFLYTMGGQDDGSSRQGPRSVITMKIIRNSRREIEICPSVRYGKVR